MSAVALRWSDVFFRPKPNPAVGIELVTAQRRIGELTQERDDERAKLAGASRTIATQAAELRAATAELVELRRHRRELLAAVRNRSSLALPADVRALIEAEELAE